MSSTTHADNVPGTPPDEGLSYILFEDGARLQKVLLRDAIEELKAIIVGERVWKAYRRWPTLAKFFDNKGALPYHIHHREQHARLVNQPPKPEAHYFPPQLNNHGADCPYTFFGVLPDTTQEQLKARLKAFSKGDNHITELSTAYRLTLGTARNVPAGLLHAPGSLCTYEPQLASDVLAMYQSLAGDVVVSEDLLWRDCPPERRGDFDYLVEVVDWEANIDPQFAEHHFMRPRPVRSREVMAGAACQENWVCYLSDAFSAKELTVLPGQTVVIKDQAAYGLIVVQGHGRMGNWDIEAPALIRFGQNTCDEFVVTESAALAGIQIHNPSASDPIVMLKHFGPDNPELASE